MVLVHGDWRMGVSVLSWCSKIACNVTQHKIVKLRHYEFLWFYLIIQSSNMNFTECHATMSIA